MADDGDLLTLDDPFLVHVRRAASRQEPAFTWLRSSMASWARAEFVRRAEDEEPDELDKRMRELRGSQVALLTSHLQLGAQLDPNGLSVPQKRAKWTVHIGVLYDGQMPSDSGYFSLDTGTEIVAGMFSVMDVFELPEDWRIEPWPDFHERAAMPPKSLGAVGTEDVPELPGPTDEREVAIERALHQAAQVTSVVYDTRTGTLNVGEGQLVLDRHELMVMSASEFEAALTQLWQACVDAEMARRGAQLDAIRRQQEQLRSR